jgi:hypothetical protein
MKKEASNSMPIADLSFKSCELIPSFIKQYLILLTLQLHSNLGMKQGLEGQTRAQKRQGDFKDNSIVVKKLGSSARQQ